MATFRRGVPSTSVGSTRHRRLRLEPLEDRFLLAVFSLSSAGIGDVNQVDHAGLPVQALAPPLVDNRLMFNEVIGKVSSALIAGPAVTSFTLINAETDLPLGVLQNGQTINLTELPTQKLNVRADTAGTIGSIRFDFDAQANFRTENTGPYSLFGDTDGDYKAGTFALGNHTLTATPFSNRNAGGTAGTVLTISFLVSNQSTPTNQPPSVSAGADQTLTLPNNSVNLDGTVIDDNFPSNPLTTTWTKFSRPGSAVFGNAGNVDTSATFSLAGTYILRLTADDGQFVRTDDVQITVSPQPTGSGVTGFTLMNAATDRPMFTITNGIQIDLAQLTTTKVNIRADATVGVRSVVFDYDGTNNVRVDSTAPYALFAETGGNFQPAVLGLGNHTLTARAFSGTDGTGSLINTFTLNFQVVVGHSIPDQIHLSWKANPSSSFTVVWRTYRLSTPSLVQYRQLGSTTWLTQTGAQKPSGTTGKQHEATVTGLAPSTQYEYRVAGDDGTWSDTYITKTAPPSGNADFDFIYFADTGLIGRLDGLATATEQIITDIAGLNPLLLLGGGDYAYYNTDKRFGPLDAHIDAWFNQSAPFLTQSVFMPTLGNHEVLLQESYDAWIQRFALPTSQDDNFRVYSFDVGQVHFVSILAAHGAQDLPDTHLNWVISDIQAAQARGQSWIIPYMHVSAFADGESHPSNFELRNQLGPVFEQLGIHLVVSSHDQNFERTLPLVNVGQGSPVVTDPNLTGYDAADGIVWLKVSPAGKLSSKNSDFSVFQTNPAPYWTAARDDTMHHFARFIVSSDNTLTTEIYATPGDGTPSFVLDSFTYSLGSETNSQTTSEAQSFVASAKGINRSEALSRAAAARLTSAQAKVQSGLTTAIERSMLANASSVRRLYPVTLQFRDRAFSQWMPLGSQSALAVVGSITDPRSDGPEVLLTDVREPSPLWESAFEDLKLGMPRAPDSTIENGAIAVN